MRACTTVALLLTLGPAIAGMRVSQARAEAEPSSVTPAHTRAAVEPAFAFLRGGNPLWAVPLGELSVTRDRPIFSASRHPPAPPMVLTVAPPPPPKPVAMPQLPDHPPLVLIGTIIGETLRIGIFLEQATSKTARLAIGESHDGWILRAVGSGEARFENADRTATLALRPPAQLAMNGNPAAATGELMTPARHRKRRS